MNYCPLHQIINITLKRKEVMSLIEDLDSWERRFQNGHREVRMATAISF